MLSFILFEYSLYYSYTIACGKLIVNGDFSLLYQAKRELHKFYNENINMVWLLLDILHGDKDLNCNLHLEVFYAMLPYNKAFEHLNRFRWGNCVLVDMNMMSKTAPFVYKTFAEERKYVVSRCSTASTFNKVSPDMALEQNKNKDSKTQAKEQGK